MGEGGTAGEHCSVNMLTTEITNVLSCISRLTSFCNDFKLSVLWQLMKQIQTQCKRVLVRKTTTPYFLKSYFGFSMLTGKTVGVHVLYYGFI